MKISFENKTLGCYKEVYHQTKAIQETCESVVPDVNDDIGKIASVQSSVYLKSKDLTGRGVLITGEAAAAVVYVTENEKSVSFVRLTKQFSIEYEIQGIDAEVLPQLRLDIQNTEARVINPRKLSVTFEICGELCCYKRGEIAVEAVKSLTGTELIHSKYNKAQIVFVNSVCEKTFTLSEQLTFPSGKPAPVQIAMLKVSFDLNESQSVGSKLIIKGSMNICVCYLSDEVNYPVKAEFSAPFSQIVDVGVDNVDSYCTLAEVSSVYYDIINTINGEKALDAEIHAVLQICTREKREIEYISDVYSNIMPAEYSLANQKYSSHTSTEQLKLVADERISVVEDCTDVLSVFSSISKLSSMPDKITAAVNLDIVYRTKSGNLSATRRSIALTADCSVPPGRIISALLSDLYLRPDGAYIDVHCTLDVKYHCSKEFEIMRVTAVELDEDKVFDHSTFPALYLVRADTNDLWTLAKTYHSSIEKILSLNAVEGGICGKLLLIPKSR